MGLNINQPPFPGEFHTKGCVWQHTFLITGGKRGLSIALIYYCVLNLMHFFLRGSRRGKQAIIVIVASRGVWLTKNVPSTLTSEREEQISQLCSVRFRSFCDYSISDWTRVHLPGFYRASLCKGQPGRARGDGAWAGPPRPNWSHVLLDPGAAPAPARGPLWCRFLWQGG